MKTQEKINKIISDAKHLQDMINDYIGDFKRKNNCDLIINVVDREIKIGALIDIDKI